MLKNIIENRLFSSILLILISISIAFILHKLISNFIEKSLKKIQNTNKNTSKRIETLNHILKSITTYCILFLLGITILTIIWGPIPLTFAGLGAALAAFASQNLIKDILNGFFILLEEQYSVGDYVTILNYSGIIERINLRITQIRDFNGTLYILPNGSITSVTNHSKGPQRFEVTFQVDYKENVQKTYNAIREALEEFNKNKEDIITPASILGITDLGARGITIKIIGTSKPLTKIKMETKLRFLIKEKFDTHHIEFAYIKLKSNGTASK